MASIATNRSRSGNDHFEPQDIDPHEQRLLRGHLEQIDYTTYAANTAVIGQMLGTGDTGQFQRMAIACAQARARWVQAAMKATEDGAGLTPEQTHKLAALRAAYDEIAAAYEAMRRLVERGYMAYRRDPAA